MSSVSCSTGNQAFFLLKLEITDTPAIQPDEGQLETNIVGTENIDTAMISLGRKYFYGVFYHSCQN